MEKLRVRESQNVQGRNRLFPGPPSNSKDPLFQPFGKDQVRNIDGNG